MYCPIKLKICVVVNVIRITCRSYFPTTIYMTDSKPLYFYYVKVICPWYLQYLTCHFSSLYQSLFRQGTFKQGDILSSTSSPFVGQCMDIIGTNYFLVVPWHERFNSHHVNTLYISYLNLQMDTWWHTSIPLEQTLDAEDEELDQPVDSTVSRPLHVVWAHRWYGLCQLIFTWSFLKGRECHNINFTAC